jgi:phosphonate transport system substrate-binding protein
MLIPSDGGTEEGTRADFAPLFDLLERTTGLEFEIRVGQSYSTVIEALAQGLVDVAYLGTVSFLSAQERGPVELLAIGETGESYSYYSGLFTRQDSGIRTMEDLHGRSLGLSDPRSSSGFVFPLALLLEQGFEPLKDFSGIILTGSHSNSLGAMAEGRVEVAAAPFESYIKAVRQGIIDPRKIHIIAKSAPIPNPPLAINGKLPPELKERIRTALHTIHEQPGVRPGTIRGHAGVVLERYNAQVPSALYDRTREIMAMVDDDLRVAILKQASER